jgi:hypothetical protein
VAVLNPISFTILNSLSPASICEPKGYAKCSIFFYV